MKVEINLIVLYCIILYCIVLYCDIIKQTDKYTYLVQTITSNGKYDDEILKII